MKHLRALQERLTPSEARRWPLTVMAGLLSGLSWAVLSRLVESQSIHSVLSELLGFDARLWLSALFLGLLVLAFSLLTHSQFAGNLIVGPAVMLLSFVNFFKVSMTSMPLTIGDFALIGQLGNIAALNSQVLFLSRNSVLAILGALLWLALVWFFSRPLRLLWRRSAIGGLASLLAFALMFCLGVNSLVFSPLGADLGRNISQTLVNQSCGAVLGLWRSVCWESLRHFSADFSEPYMTAQLAQAKDYAADVTAEKRDTQPNIILILSESFFDVTALEGVSFDTDPLADFHALQREGVSGSFYTRSLGYGTCDVELELLTGMNTGLISNEDLYSWDSGVFSCWPAIPALLRENGYYTSMLHLFDDSIYNRSDIFPYLGFDDMYFSGDFAQFYPPAADADNYWGYMSTRISGEFYSDDLMTDLLIAQYEKFSAQLDGSLFLYGTSMENHQPYAAGKYSEEELTVRPSSVLTGEAEDNLLQFSQGVSNASAALGKLVDYFRDCAEPTVIIFYGDHRPGFGLSDGETVYSKLGLVPSDRGKWGLEDIAELYSTSYLIWSNDPDYLPGEPGDTLDTSCNYLGAEILRISGIEQPLYWKLVNKLSRTRTADMISFHLSRAGELSETAPTEGDDALGLELLRDIINDTVYGNRYITEQIGEISGG